MKMKFKETKYILAQQREKLVNELQPFKLPV